MEWKSTNISKKEFEQKQKEFMREAMDMSKRARPLTPNGQNISVSADGKDTAAKTDNAEKSEESVSVQSGISAAEATPAAAVNEEPAEQASAPAEGSMPEDNGIQVISVPAADDAAKDPAQKEDIPAAAVREEPAAQTSAPAKEAADDKKSAEASGTQVTDGAAQTLARDEDIPASAGVYDAEDYKNIFEGVKDDRNVGYKVPDFNELIKNHNSSAETGCENCRSSRQHEEDG